MRGITGVILRFERCHRHAQPIIVKMIRISRFFSMGEAVRRAIIFGVLFFALMNAAEAGCYVTEGTTGWGIEGRLYFASDGGGCRLPLLYVGHAGEVHSFRIVSSPKHGKASASGLTVYYIPRSGYKGEDEFVFAITGRLNGQPQRATIRVSVTVR